MTTITNNKLTGLGENHPANGPLTTERLTHVRDVLQRNLQYSNGGSMDYIIADAVKAIDELLAGRKAEPVGEVIEQPASMIMDGCVSNEKATYRNIKGIHKMKRMPLGTKFYTAPPAPVVQCPFPCGWDNLNKYAIQDAAFVACGLVEGEVTTEAHRRAAIMNNDRLLKVISACRAAMLSASPAPVSVPEDFLCMLTGRAKYLRGKGEVKSPELLERAAAMLNHSGDTNKMEAIKQQSTTQPNNGAMSGDAVKQSSSNAQRR
ncbi:hypothetical protein [Citrobacter koseri]|uniref:hypothetical protein n=1 Tax=Citrobacter koseri TaxID=545 RepID=UPI000D73F1AE|nr:hypothetical protein [Citrobacter koseri]PWY09411.1 hypothetical protein DL345_07150 [Citrobacter koseri]PWY16301.1 hypothetical protein DL345_00485 [Citrobacter koseri]